MTAELHNNQDQNGSRIRMILIWFGDFPDFFSYFLKSIGENALFNLLILSDREVNLELPTNVEYKKFTIAEFNQLSSEKLGFDITIQDPYKICDFKPVFGLIFDEFIRDSDFWGYCDMDMIPGNVSRFINESQLAGSAIISAYSSFLSGPFCLYRNDARINSLFMKCPDYKRILQDPEHHAFDENIFQLKYKGIKAKKIWLSVLFIMKLVSGKYKLRNARYQFQWFYKKRAMDHDHPVDMTEVVWTATHSGDIRSLFLPLLQTDPLFTKTADAKWQYTWKSGILRSDDTNQEIMGIHFQESKHNDQFVIENLNPDTNSFTISANGIKNG